MSDPASLRERQRERELEDALARHALTQASAWCDATAPATWGSLSPAFEAIANYARHVSGAAPLKLTLRWQGAGVWFWPLRREGQASADFAIAVADDVRFPRHAGLLSSGGQLMARRDGHATSEDWGKIGSLLDYLSDCPGQLEGLLVRSERCFFCAQLLTEDRSRHAGYGPCCAKNFRLPW